MELLLAGVGQAWSAPVSDENPRHSELSPDEPPPDEPPPDEPPPDELPPDELPPDELPPDELLPDGEEVAIFIRLDFTAVSII